jgi:hypothetical protein
MRIPEGLACKETEADEKNLHKNGEWEQPGNNQVEHANPFNDHVVLLYEQDSSLMFEDSHAKSSSQLCNYYT